MQFSRTEDGVVSELVIIDQGDRVSIQTVARSTSMLTWFKAETNFDLNPDQLAHAVKELTALRDKYNNPAPEPPRRT